MTEFRKITNYPKIYNVYWGNFLYDSTRNNDIHEIFKNRNRFVTDYNISHKQPGLKNFKGLIGDLRSKHHEYFDHSECYKINNGKYILLVSPYKPFDIIKYKMEELQFTQIYKMYSNHTTTWIKIFDDMENIKIYHNKYTS